MPPSIISSERQVDEPRGPSTLADTASSSRGEGGGGQSGWGTGVLVNWILNAAVLPQRHQHPPGWRKRNGFKVFLCRRCRRRRCCCRRCCRCCWPASSFAKAPGLGAFSGHASKAAADAESITRGREKGRKKESAEIWGKEKR